MRRALIFGVNGQDGSYLAEQLLAAGWEVHGVIRRSSVFNTARLDHLDPHSRGAAKRLHLHYGDVTDGTSIRRVLDITRPEHVYNLAAMSHVRVSFEVPEYTAEATGVGALRLFEAIRASGQSPRVYNACHDMATSAITPRGIKSYDQLAVGDEVLTLNTETGAVETRRIKKVFIDDYDGEMICINSKRLDQCLTPNHRVLLQPDDGTCQYIQAQYLKDKFKHDTISHLSMPRAWNVAGNDVDVIDIREVVTLAPSTDNVWRNLNPRLPAGALFYLIGLYLGDGFLKKKQRAIVKYQTDGEDLRSRAKDGTFAPSPRPRNIKRVYDSKYIQFSIGEQDHARESLLQALRECGLFYREHETTVDLSSEPLARLLDLCHPGVTPDRHGRMKCCYFKEIPSFVWSCGPRNLQRLFDGLVDSDGHVRKNSPSRYYFTSSKRLLSDVIRLCTMLGKHCSWTERMVDAVTLKDGRSFKPTVPCYTININHRQTNKVYRPHITRIPYRGKVWCAEVDGNSNFLCSRSGKVFFSGNSSSELFGNAPPPQRESTLMVPRSPYGCAKLFAYVTAINYREAYGMHVSSGILFNHESPRRAETFLSRKVTRAAARIKLCRQDKLFLGNLDARRDWGYAPEYTAMMTQMLERDVPGDYVVATGESHTVREFVDAAFSWHDLDYRRYVEHDSKYVRPTEVDHLLGDASKARAVLGWEPRVKFTQLVHIMALADLESERAKL